MINELKYELDKPKRTGVVYLDFNTKVIWEIYNYNFNYQLFRQSTKEIIFLYCYNAIPCAYFKVKLK